MEYGFCYLGAVPVRENPKSISPQVTQLLFGEIVYILNYYTGENEITDNWVKIRNATDSYEGWIDGRNIIKTNTFINRTATYLISSDTAKIKMDGNIIPVAKASRLFGQRFYVGGHYFSLLDGDITPIKQNDVSNLITIALSYLNSPYQWGGKTPLGLDCSGFTQCVYSFAGITLPRDAYQQAETGNEVKFAELEKGDLCFFDNKNGHITHVGIYLGKGKIIHCSSKVRIDGIIKDGIIPSDNQNALSHHFCSAKRILQG